MRAVMWVAMSEHGSVARLVCEMAVQKDDLMVVLKVQKKVGRLVAYSVDNLVSLKVVH